jgi:hypothetical protein
MGHWLSAKLHQTQVSGGDAADWIREVANVRFRLKRRCCIERLELAGTAAEQFRPRVSSAELS